MSLSSLKQNLKDKHTKMLPYRPKKNLAWKFQARFFIRRKNKLSAYSAFKILLNTESPLISFKSTVMALLALSILTSPKNCKPA